MKIKKIYSGRLIEVELQRRCLPNGYKAALEVIKHPGAALIVPFIGNNRIIMLKQYRPVINSYIYELPAGTLDRNEKPSECAKREIIEETSYKAGSIKRLGAIYPAPGYTTEKIVIFKAEKLQKVNAPCEADEIIKTHIFTKTEVKKLFKKGQIVDAKTICALSLCGWL